jgi:hypothetical protein
MKKIILITFLSFFISSISHSQSSSSSMIKNKKVDEVKAQLVNFEINQGYEIENETNNTISFTKKASGGFLETSILVMRYGGGEFYDRNRYNFSQSGSDVRIFYFREMFSSKSNEAMKLGTLDDMKQLNQDYLNQFVNSVK